MAAGDFDFHVKSGAKAPQVRSMEEEHNTAAYGGEGHDGCFQQRERGQVCHFGADPGAHGKSCQGLEENPEVQMAADKVAKAAGGGDGEDNHHAGADGLEKGYAEDDHEGNLYVGRGADTEGAGQEAGDYACGNAVEIQFPSGEDCLPHVKMMVQPVCLVELHVKDEGAGEDHETCHKAQVVGRHTVGNGSPQKGADNAACTDDGAYFHHHFMFPEMADSAGNHGKRHGSQGHRQSGVDRHAKTYGEKSNGNAGPAGAYEADKGSQ